MSETPRERRISGGRVPSQTVTALYFFGPFLIDELKRYRYDVVRSAQEEGVTEELPAARISYNALSSYCAIRLPAELTVPIPKAHRKGDGFEFNFERKLFNRLSKQLSAAEDVWVRRLNGALAAEDYSATWELLFAKHLGKNYRTLPSYKALVADLVTIAAGVELFLYRYWDEEGRELAQQAPRILRDFDEDALERVSIRTGVSSGVVLAAVIQLAGRKGSAKARAALGSGDWQPLHDMLWSPLVPEYLKHPYHRLFGEKMQDPGIKAKAGRPVSAPVGPPPIALETPPAGDSDRTPPRAPQEGPAAPVPPPVSTPPEPAPKPKASEASPRAQPPQPTTRIGLQRDASSESL